MDGGERNASAKPSRCNSCSSVSIEYEMSTAMTRARSTSVWVRQRRARDRKADRKPERRSQCLVIEASGTMRPALRSPSGKPP